MKKSTNNNNMIIGLRCAVIRTSATTGEETITPAEIVSIGRKWVKILLGKRPHSGDDKREIGLVSPNQIVNIQYTVVTPFDAGKAHHKQEVSAAVAALTKSGKKHFEVTNQSTWCDDYNHYTCIILGYK